MIPFVDLKAQLKPIRSEVDAAIAAVLDKTNFVLGDPVAEFEGAFARFVGSKHAVGVGNGLDALTVQQTSSAIGTRETHLIGIADHFVEPRDLVQHGIAWTIDPEQVFESVRESLGTSLGPLN